jgi:multidrug efflux pump
MSRNLAEAGTTPVKSTGRPITIISPLTRTMGPTNRAQALFMAMAELQAKAAGSVIPSKPAAPSKRARRVPSIALIFPMMILLMPTILMARLQSFQKMFLAISVAPAGPDGVVMVLLPTRRPMGFVAVLGIIALNGMIIRNSVILVDQIDWISRED